MTDQHVELVERMAGGDESALEALYDATSRRVFGLALHILGDRDAAEEATLDTYHRAWRRAGDFDPERGSVLAWLLTTARSRALDRLRARARRAGREGALDAAVAVPDSGPTPEEATGAAEDATRVRRALVSLPFEQRSVIEAAYFSGLTYTEVATTLGQPVGTVKTRIRTGLSTLRGLLAEVQP